MNEWIDGLYARLNLGLRTFHYTKSPLKKISKSVDDVYMHSCMNGYKDGTISSDCITLLSVMLSLLLTLL